MGDGSDQPTEKARIRFFLLTTQFNYLERRAEREEISLSRALENIIARYRDVALEPVRKPVMKAPLMTFISVDHLTLIDRLAVKHGMSRSEITRRLIDQELSEDKWPDW